LGGAHAASNLAFFLQGEWELNRWRPMLGFRYDAHSVYGNQLSPRTGLVYQAGAHDILRASLGRAFRAPTFAELFVRDFLVWTPYFDGSNWVAVPFRVNGSPTNKPEEVLAFEVGWKHIHPNGWRWDAAYFAQDIRNVITVFMVDPGDPFLRQYRNLARLRVSGYSLELSGRLLPPVELALGYMRVDYRGDIRGRLQARPRPLRYPNGALSGAWAERATGVQLPCTQAWANGRLWLEHLPEPLLPQ
jgi:outer membrane receptor for ferrienterochelin and colicins